MKKGLCLLMILALTITIFVACNKNMQQGEEQSSEPGSEQTGEQSSTQGSGQGNEQSSEQVEISSEPSKGLEFRSNGNGSCTLVSIGACIDTYVVIPETSPNGDRVTHIGEFAFESCSSLSDIYIPDGVIFIGESAFLGCIALTSITIPDSVTSIGRGAFSGCTGLTSVFIPNSVITIDVFAFANCSGLTSIIVEDGNPTYHSAGNCLIETESKTLLTGCMNSVIPDDGSVTSIRRWAFYDCAGLKNIIIPESVKDIDDFSFTNCIGLTNITIPYGVSFLGLNVFSGCTGLTSVTIPESVATICVAAFSGCNNLTDVYYIGTQQDWEVVRVLEDNIPLTSATIHCQPYGEDFPAWSEGLLFESYGDGTCCVSGVGECTDTQVVIPKVSPNGDKVTSIAGSAFLGCEHVTSVKIPYCVTSIGGFNDCINLKNIILSEGITTIWGGFSGCKSLQSVTLPDSVVSIGEMSFYGCNSLTSVIIPANVSYVGEGAFGGCIALENIIVSEANTSYHSVNNCLIETATGTLIVGCKNSTIPDGVTRIGEYAFFNRSEQTNVTVPDSVISIGDYAFADCINLKHITISDNVERIDSHTFSGCINLENITIPDSVMSIGDYAFAGCTNLKSITIPDNIECIDSHTFSGCVNLGSITIPNRVTIIEYNMFNDCDALTDITYYGTIKDWIDIGGSYYGEQCVIHCVDGDISVELGLAINALQAMCYERYKSLGDMYEPYLTDVELLDEVWEAYKPYLNSEIDYEEYAKYAEAEQGTKECELYKEYLAFRTARSRYTTGRLRRLNDIVNMYNYLEIIKESNVEIRSIVKAFPAEHLPILLDVYGCELLFEEGKEADLSAITNMNQLPDYLASCLRIYVILTQGDYPMTPDEAQSLYDSAVAAVVEPGYITIEEIEKRTSSPNPVE